MVGLFSLGIGIVLLALILLRGQQAAREGNQELRNDTYWVLVSPLVFSSFGLYLLRTPGRGRSGTLPVRPPMPTPQLQRRVSSARREAEQSQQQLLAVGGDADRHLREARQELARVEAAAQASEQQLQEASAKAEQRIMALEAQLNELRQVRSSTEQDLASAAAESDQRLRQASEQLASAQAATEASEQRLHQAAEESQRRIAGLEQQLDGMRQARDRAEADLQTLLDSRTTLKADGLDQAVALRRQLESLTGELEQRLSQAHSDHTSSLSTQQVELERLQQQLHAATAAAISAREEAGAATAALEGRMQSMAGQLQTLEQERHKLLQELQQLQHNGAAKSEQALAAAEAARTDLHTLLGQLSNQQSELRQGLEAFVQSERHQLAEARRQLDGALQQLEQAHARQNDASAIAGNRLVQLDQEIQQAQQAGVRSRSDVADAIRSLEQARTDLEQGLQSGRLSVATLTEQISNQMGRARDSADRALQMSQDAQTRLEGFLQTADRQTAAQQSVASAGPDPVQASYYDACAEIGVVPGSDWIVVRATWRRNLKHWHPDQGGDAQRWNRRNAAYQLLSAWYDFHGAT